MISSPWWDRHARDELAVIREARSGLTGFGRRPALHPTWQEPAAEGMADPAEDATALVIALGEHGPRS